MQQNKIPIQENQELEVKIESVGERGDGIARVKGFVLFVGNTKPGDYVKIRVTKLLKNVGFAEVITRLEGKSNEEKAEKQKKSDQKSKSPEVKNKELDIKVDPTAEDSEDFGEDIDDFDV